MPIIYLSPSTQEANRYITGSGSEEENMNLLADAMVPYLLSNGIRYQRNRPDMTAASSIRQGNSGEYDLYLALHSNAAGEGNEGNVRGIIAFYYPGSKEGERAAHLFVSNLKRIYPLPEQVYARSTTALGEVRQPRFPSVLLELGYHDNAADALWVEENREAIAANLVQSLTQYFDLPFIYPQPVQYGVVATEGGNLNLRSTPSAEGSIVARLPNRSKVTVWGQWQGWYVVHCGNYVGYAVAAYISL